MDEIDYPPCVIVCFTNEIRKGKKMIDIVPKTWLVPQGEKDWKCLYSPKNESDVYTLVKE